MIKKIIIALILLSAVSAHAVNISYLQETWYEKLWRCTWHLSCYRTLGTSVTTIQGTDTLSASRTTINNNFTALNDGKVENATTSMASLTTLANLSTVGTITTGNWSATAIPVGKGGTGTTSPSLYRVMLGNGDVGLTHASSTGSSGQFLTSNGSGAYPSWQSSTVNQGDNYTWTGTHSFSATTTMATTTINHLGVGTSTPSLLAKLAVNGDAYITGGLGVGTATTSDGNLVVTGLASTTNLIISDTCTGCLAYTASSTSFSLSSSSNIFVGSIPVNAKMGIIDVRVTDTTGTATNMGTVTLMKSGLTDVFFGIAQTTTDGQYEFLWQGANMTDFQVAENADEGGDSSVTGTAYWYK